jgi:hypothetical protein
MKLFAFLNILINGLAQEIFNLVKGFVDIFNPNQKPAEVILKISIPFAVIVGRLLYIKIKEWREEKEAIEAVKKEWEREWEQKQKKYHDPKDTFQLHMPAIIPREIEENNKKKEQVSAALTYRILIFIAIILFIFMLVMLIGRFE